MIQRLIKEVQHPMQRSNGLKMPSVTQWLKQLRLSRVCILCNHYHLGYEAVCINCHEYLTPIPSACLSCAEPLPMSDFMTCGTCIKKKPFVDYTFAPYRFEDPLRSLLHEFKYRHGLYLISFLAQLILKNLPEKAMQTECLIPVPMHTKRLRIRGFNQAAEIAKFVGNALNIPCEMNLCQKIIHTKPQAGLSAADRKKNLSNVFQVTSSEYTKITLIDDLLTTGNTVNELAKAFKQQGVTHVAVWCCARTAETY